MRQRPPSRRARPALAAALAAGAILSSTGPARAGGFAEPPPSRRVVALDRDEHFSLGERYDDLPRLSVVRFLVGPALKADAESALPGLYAAVEIGRGPAGMRLSASWLDVGHERGLSQYTGELTLDFGGRSRFRPVIGAGGGVTRTSSSARPDGTLDTTTGATMGVGLVRAGLGVRLPFSDTDARVNLDVTGVLPAIRGSTAPDLGPWVVTGLSVGIGF